MDDLFKNAVERSRKQFGNTEHVKHKYEWECTRCRHTFPASYKDGKLSLTPPVLCESEHCSSSTFTLNTVD